MQAFEAQDALGVVAVEGAPGLEHQRARLLPQASQLAHLASEVQARCSSPQSNYSVGWSHGQEKYKEGQADSLKGSFYANPLFDDPAAGLPQHVRETYHSAPFLASQCY